jgi:PhzF family phenazine biosynthesis protein
MGMTRRFEQVDVFSAEPCLGNPVAVVVDADGLSDEQMRRFAVWTNLSETTFLLPPTDPAADYRVRIFTPGRELPFAGHPTLGSAHAWLEAGGRPRSAGKVVQQCGVGLVELRRDDVLAFAAPPTTRSGPLDEPLLDALATGLGIDRAALIDHQRVVNGPNWLCVRLGTADEVLALEPDFGRLGALGADIGVIGFYPAGSPCRYETRAFALDAGVSEDPVTGSLGASVAQWLHRVGAVPDHYVAAQGARVGRAGRVHVDIDPDGTVWIGGATVTRVTGTVNL